MCNMADDATRFDDEEDWERLQDDEDGELREFLNKRDREEDPPSAREIGDWHFDDELGWP